MTDQAWNLTVSYDPRTGETTVTGPDGTSADETIFEGETDTVTLQPGDGVSAVTGITIRCPVPMPSGVAVSAQPRGNALVITDTDTLASDAAEVDVEYCILFKDASGKDQSTDPKLINKPTPRPEQ